MLVEGLAVNQSFGSLSQCVVAYQQVGHQIYQQQLPGGQCAVLLYQHAAYQQHSRDDYQRQFVSQAAFVVMFVVVTMSVRAALMFVFVLVFVMVMMMFV